MARLQSVFLFILGLCIGSFLNVVVYRLNFTLRESRSLPRHLRGVLGGRSFCPQCKRKIIWCDNIPLLSFILLRGKCRSCHSPISWQYPLVELATGILTVLVVFHLAGVEVVASPPPRWPEGLLGGVLFFSFNDNPLFTIYYLLIAYSLIAIFVSDFRYRTIPDWITYPAMGLTILFQLLVHLRGAPQAQHHLGGVLFSGLGAAGFFLFLVLVTRGKGMGVGDVKLAGLMGLILAFPKIVVALFLAFLTGAVVGVILILLGKKRFGEEVPFGPFLAGATWLSLFWGDFIWQWYWRGIF